MPSFRNIETKRLILRQIVPEDVEDMFELDSDPEVNKYLGNNPVQTREQIAGIIQFIRKQYEDNGIGRWAVIDKRTNEFLGWSGLKLMKEEVNGHSNYYDLGYRFMPKYWGKGIATEAALAWLDYAFDQLKAEQVFAIAETGNAGSNRVLQKVGFSLENVFEYDGSPHNWYSITKGELRIEK